jgi:pimeloyl-ACP methyl ester carboxylesterase
MGLSRGSIITRAVLLVGLGPAPAAAQATTLDRTPSRFATFEGMRIHFKSVGTGRTAVVFVHCWACDLTVWRHQVDVVAGRSRVILLDLPGHGRTAKPEIRYTMGLFARAVNAVLETAGVDQAVLVGHSMGTPVIREFYRLYPKKTLGLVVVDGSLRRPELDSAGTQQLVRRLDGPGYRQALEEMVTSMYPAETQAPLRRAILQIAVATPQHVVAGSMQAMVDPSIWTADPIAVPVLVVVAKGPNWPPSYRTFVERLAPSLQYEEMEGVAHFLMMERPDAFNSILARFLSSVEGLR